MNNLTVSLETAQELKEAGFPQDSTFAYYSNAYYSKKENAVTILRFSEGKEHLLLINSGEWDFVCVAPTAEEILEKLPTAIYIKKRIHKWEYWINVERLSHGWIIRYCRGKETLCIVVAPVFTEALGEMYLYLKKEGLI